MGLKEDCYEAENLSHTSAHKYVAVTKISASYPNWDRQGIYALNTQCAHSAHIGRPMCALCAHYVYRAKMGLKEDC